MKLYPNNSNKKPNPNYIPPPSTKTGDNERRYYAGVDMTDWDFSYNEDDPKFIYKAFIAICNYVEELTDCAECPLKNLCMDYNGLSFWRNVFKELKEVNL